MPASSASPPRTGDHQRHVSAAPCIGAVVPVADQQEREQAGQLPEKHDLNQIAGHHQAEHGAHESQEKREETRYRIIWRHVVAGVERDQRTNAQHQHRKQPGEAVDTQNEVHPQARQPEVLFANNAAVGDLREPQCHLDSAAEGDQTGQKRFCVTRVVRQKGRQTAADERQKQ